MAIDATAAADRLISLDAIRGVAVLGILLMNIIGFAFHFSAYTDPTIQGGASGIRATFQRRSKSGR